MRTRRQLKNEDPNDGHTYSASKSKGDQDSLSNISKEAVGKLLNRANSRRGQKGRRDSNDMDEKLPIKHGMCDKEHAQDFNWKDCISTNGEESTSNRGEERSVHCDANEMDWEDGTISMPELKDSYAQGREVTVEFTDSPASQKKRSRRATTEDKELAELVHKVHLLCLLARGRLVDNACNDPLIQASILSLLPSYLLKIMEIPKLKANMLGSLVRWFHENFHVRSQSVDRGSFHSNLAYALEAREGTAEEVAALSVALFRALNLITRYVSILDVASLKPEVDLVGAVSNESPRLDARLYSSTTSVASSLHTADSFDTAKEHNAHESQDGKLCKKDTKSTCRKSLLKEVAVANQSDIGSSPSVETKSCGDNVNSCPTTSAPVSKRKGDKEFELQMEMALSSTAVGTLDGNSGSEFHDLQNSSLSLAPPLKKQKKTNPIVSADSALSAVWSRKNGPPLYWAEVYCSLETLTGRWVHIDAANGVVDGEQNVEAAAAACRRPLKYAVAFAGNGAKDVTRRYCMQWYKISPRRINSEWWDMVLAPLRELESAATGEIGSMEAFQETASDLDEKRSKGLHLPSCNPIQSYPSKNYQDNERLAGGPNAECSQRDCVNFGLESMRQFHKSFTGITLEDAELETRALTEPLPTNQLAYKSHHLYAIERWLTKHQILHPRDPILGYCSGLPVYPRSCVQTLQTKNRWLREGLQVKENEAPAKVVKHSKRNANLQMSERDISEDVGEPTTELYGKWQLEPLQLPHAVNGNVPKNEWGRVDAWSEKCLPPGTVHLRLPRLASVAKRLGIDFAPAMVGFEFRNGRSFPAYEGIVVCTEFRNTIMEAYEEEEERRASLEKKRNEAEALARWFQLLTSIITRQRLQNSYINSSPLRIQPDESSSPTNNIINGKQSESLKGDKKSRGKPRKSVRDVGSVLPSANDHEHVFPSENQSFDEESMIRTKQCPCGFSIQVEEM